MTGFTFFQNYYNAISDEENGLSEEEQGRLYNAIFAYMFRDEDPNLKGACKMAFNLIKPSLDRSKRNGINKSIKNDSDSKNGNEMESNGNEMENEISPFFEKKEDRSKNKELSTDGLSAGAREDTVEIEETVEGYLEFMREHPEIQEDLQNPSLIASIDFPLLARKIAESSFLRTRNSLSWLIGNYPKIISDSYKDFKRTRASPAEKSAGRFAKSTKEQLDEAFGEKDT